MSPTYIRLFQDFGYLVLVGVHQPELCDSKKVAAISLDFVGLQIVIQEFFGRFASSFVSAVSGQNDVLRAEGQIYDAA